MLRKTFFWAHLIAGSVAGVVIFILSLTGVLLAFERQINSWSDARVSVPDPGAGKQWLPLEDLATRLQAAAPPSRGSAREGAGPGGGLTLAVHPSPRSPLEVAYSREKTVLVNPYTGQVLGEQARGTREFFGSVEKVHRALGGALRNSFGRSVVGACNFVFLLLVLSGLYLWLPKRWDYKYLRPALWFRGGLSGRARDWNWHNTIGFWCFVPLFFIVLSGVIMSYQWANDLLYKMTGTQPPVVSRPGAPADSGRRRAPSASTESPRPMLELLGTVERQSPDWRSISFQMPREGSPTVTFTVDHGTGGQPQKRWTKILNRATGATVHQDGFEDLNAGRKLRTIARFLHTGEILGLPGQLVAALASLGGTLLVWTGLSLALRRFTRWRDRRRGRPISYSSPRQREAVSADLS